ncbi:MAG: TauD/TfdA family dioxygenase [Brevundimonas sp.]
MQSIMVAITPPAEGRPYVILTAEAGDAPDTLDRDQVVALYKQHGALLFRGFPLDLAAFPRFTGRFCASSVFNESPGRLVLDGEHNIQSVNGGADAFPLHPELSREPWKPDVCFFLCLTPPREGGETTLCDGVDVVRRLPAEVRDGLAGRRLLYVQPATPQTLRYWLGTDRPSPAQLAAPPRTCPYRFAAAANGQIVRAFTRPALHRPMFTEAPAFGNFLLFARYYLNLPNFPALDNGQPVPLAWVEAVKAVSDAITVPVQWQAGDLVMIDNSRFMHGRRPILDMRDRLIASYFGYLDFAVPDAEEPPNAPWRQGLFVPPDNATARTPAI